MKTCSKCKIEKPESDFCKEKRKKDGLCSQCKICKNKTTRKYRATSEGREAHRKEVRAYQQTLIGKAVKIKAIKKYRSTTKGKEILGEANKKQKTRDYIKYKLFIDDLKLKAGCSVCGYNKDPKQLDHHHVDKATKFFSISHGHYYTKVAILTELAKCIVVCKPHHRKLHKTRIGIPR